MNKPKYILIFSRVWDEWICIDKSKITDGRSPREVFQSEIYFTSKHYKYIKK